MMIDCSLITRFAENLIILKAFAEGYPEIIEKLRLMKKDAEV